MCYNSKRIPAQLSSVSFSRLNKNILQWTKRRSDTGAHIKFMQTTSSGLTKCQHTKHKKECEEKVWDDFPLAFFSFSFSFSFFIKFMRNEEENSFSLCVYCWWGGFSVMPVWGLLGRKSEKGSNDETFCDITMRIERRRGRKSLGWLMEK